MNEYFELNIIWNFTILQLDLAKFITLQHIKILRIKLNVSKVQEKTIIKPQKSPTYLELLSQHKDSTTKHKM